MGNGTVVIPLADEGRSSHVFINLDSTVLRDFNAKSKTEGAIQLGINRYISAVYFTHCFCSAVQHYTIWKL